MNSRRKFIYQGTLAAGAFAFLKPLKTAAHIPGFELSNSRNISLFNLADLCSTQGGIPSSLSTMKRTTKLAQQKNFNSVMVGAGNVLNTAKGTREDHIKDLNLLSQAGCDALIGGPTELSAGEAYFTSLAKETSANALVDAAFDNLLPYHIVYKGNVKVGIIGNTKVQDIELAAELLNKTSSFLKGSEKCNLVVALHPIEGKNEKTTRAEKAVAELTKDIDVIVSRNVAARSPFYIGRNASRSEVIVHYSKHSDARLKSLDILFNEQMEKSFIAARPALS